MATITLCRTETLKLNRMKVTEFWVGQKHTEKDSVSAIPSLLVQLIHQALAFTHSPGTESEFFCGPAEKSILSWTVVEFKMDVDKTKRSCAKLLQVEDLNSQKNRRGVLIGRNIDDSVHVHWKGSADTILAMCSSYYDASGVVKDLDDIERTNLEHMIRGMAVGSSVCIGFAHKQVPEEEYEDPHEKKMLNGNCLTLVGLVGIRG